MDDAKHVAVERARMLGLDVLDAEVLRDQHHTLVRLRPSPVLARVAHAGDGPRDEKAHMRNEVRVAEYLAGRGAPVVPPAPAVDPGPHEVRGRIVSYWTYIESRGPVDPLSAGRALARCHRTLRGADLELDGASGDPRFEALRIFAELCDGGVVDRRRGRRLAQAAERDLEAAEALVRDRQIVHGDAHLENVLVGGRGPLWNDWEDAFVGSVEWDLACLVATAQVTGAGRDRTRTAVRGYGIEQLDSSLDVFVRFRAFQVATWLLTMADRDRSMVERAQPWLACVEPRRRVVRGPARRVWRGVRAAFGR